MPEPVAVTDKDFDQVVLKAALPVVVDFWAPWCGPCRLAAPVVAALAKEYAGKITFAKLNVDENPQTAIKYSVRGIPTFILFQEGKPMKQLVGYRPREEFKETLEQALNPQPKLG